ncbi:hypothetical protein HHK36_008548 [Tetracentron sinense]|uniref:Uncharacterized protein n=1 Tax=Tetracentron sinense TaxID=13715 RepID=A0A834ZMS9_TETSI|nr:hypothetical protein HHK36_008548 [Tetracentron sinense]
MEVKNILNMNGGTGEMSYAKNSALQNAVLSTAKPIVKDATLDLCRTTIPERFCIAELGCSSGPNALFMISEIIKTVYERCHHMGRPAPEIQAHLNDLPGNDFNTVFGLLPAFYRNLSEGKGSHLGPCFVAAMPGSFYGRLFPSKSLHFVHSSSSLHWLSKVPQGLSASDNTPLNKGRVYISKTSPPYVFRAYLAQFQSDFSQFLKSRSEEIVVGGRMILTFMCRKSTDTESYYMWDLLTLSLNELVLEGLIEEEKVDSFNAPYFAPSLEEIKWEIQKEKSFALECMKMIEIDWDTGVDSCTTGEEKGCSSIDTLKSGKRVAMTLRAGLETMLINHFGEEIMDQLFEKMGNIAGSMKRARFADVVISTVRQG